LALDYCTTPNSAKLEECGLAAADAWCRNFGYDRTTGFTGPTPVSSGAKTLAVSSNLTCEAANGKNCSTFVAVNCIREKLFLAPKVEGKVLDWCVEGDKGCGREAANDFCFKQGFSHGSWSYGGPYLSSFSDTYQPKNGRVCNSRTEKCQAFSSIFCER
jgi:hypothetical protein